MNSIRSRLASALIAAVFVTLSTQVQIAFAQPAPAATPVRAVLALTSLPTVVDAPLFFKLSKIELAAGQTTKYFGPVGFIYVLSGSLAAQTPAGQRLLQQDDAVLVAAGTTHSLSAKSEAAVFLHFVLARSTELDQATEQPPAVVTEFYRTPRSIPHLKPGRYEFTLTRVSFPPRMAPNPPHHRSGAALYYILSGSGTFIADDKTEVKETGMPHFEPQGWVHQWGNGGDTRLVLLQANISEEGVPAVIMGQPSPSGPGR